jgi:hypothetical protein
MATKKNDVSVKHPELIRPRVDPDIIPNIRPTIPRASTDATEESARLDALHDIPTARRSSRPHPKSPLPPPSTAHQQPTTMPPQRLRQQPRRTRAI